MTEIKPIQFKQDGIKGGFFYALAHLLNNESVINEKHKFVNRPLLNFYKSKTYHKYTGQLSSPEIFLDRTISIPIFSTGFSNPKYRNLFEFEEFYNDMIGLYNVKFVEVFLTPKRMHTILLIKDMSIYDEIFVIDSMEDFIIKMNGTEFFNTYYVSSCDELFHKFDGKIYLPYEQISHLI